ncbi:uncharacterized protein [Phaseolus vulgaris]|uniref:uncharacterized protein n=1 Tax=Phaseolus vulgaris TaxID=3885 RepID=UPI0035CB207D
MYEKSTKLENKHKKILFLKFYLINIFFLSSSSSSVATFLHSTICFLLIHSQSQSRSSFSVLLVLDFTLSLIQLVRLTILFFVQIQVNHSQSLYLVLATRNIVGDGAQTQYDLQCHRLQVVRTIRCLTSLLWGAIVDRIGRKPVILAGIILVQVYMSMNCMLSFEDSHNYQCLLHFSVIFNTLFGLSKSFWMAILTRFLLGCFNGFLGPVRVSIVLAQPHNISICTVKTMKKGEKVILSVKPQLKVIGKLQDGTLFLKKGHDDEGELFEFKTDKGLSITSN